MSLEHRVDKRNGRREVAELSGGQIPENLEGQNKELGPQPSQGFGQSMFLREHPGRHEGEWMARAGLGAISPGPQCPMWPEDV